MTELLNNSSSKRVKQSNLTIGESTLTDDEVDDQGRINDREPGQPIVRLTQFKRDNTVKWWLFDKYYQIQFVDKDKNPDGDVDDESLEDESLWERK